MTVNLQYKGGANWRVKKPSLISISKAPGALFRKNTSIPNAGPLDRIELLLTSRTTGPKLLKFSI